MRVNVYTDGACSGNPVKGGYGIVMEWVGKPYKKELNNSNFNYTKVKYLVVQKDECLVL